MTKTIKAPKVSQEPEPNKASMVQTDEKDAKIKQLEDKVKELTDLLQRLQAEFENYKKRTEKDNQEYCKLANAQLVTKILPILDSFELALQNQPSDEANKEFIKGIELIYSQFFDVLEKAGLKKIDAFGKKFDPYQHEVLLQRESEAEPNTIIDVLQKGYTFNGRLIRSAKVALSKKACCGNCNVPSDPHKNGNHHK